MNELIQLLLNMVCTTSIALMGPTLAETGTTAECMSPEEVTSTFWQDQSYDEEGTILGFFDGNENHIVVSNDLTMDYTIEVLWHEAAHAWDLKKGTELNGYPSWYSETHTGFDVEQFARLQTLHLGVWPEWEVFPDVTPTDSEWALMEQAGWLM
jgi:hypothetical protein